MSPHRKEEVQAFSLRLQTLLRNQGKPTSPTALARDFNLRWRGAPVTVNATRKWLLGQAMPTMDKLAVLANLLNTSSDWLRWGVPAVEEPVNLSHEHSLSRSQRRLHEAKASFAQDFQLLSATHQKLVSAVIEVLLNEQRRGLSSRTDGTDD